MGCAQGTDVCVRVPASRQGRYLKRSALHWASAKGLAGTVAQLLALGADATLTDPLVRMPPSQDTRGTGTLQGVYTLSMFECVRVRVCACLSTESIQAIGAALGQ